MASSKRQTTFAKLARERSVQEKRQLKQERKEERKQAAAAAKLGEAEGPEASGEELEASGDETADVQREENPG